MDRSTPSVRCEVLSLDQPSPKTPPAIGGVKNHCLGLLLVARLATVPRDLLEEEGHGAHLTEEQMEPLSLSRRAELALGVVT